MWRAIAIFLFGGFLGTAFGVAVGFFAFPFVFAPPDLLQLRYQEEIEAIVIKTVAIRPHGEWSGLGRVLIVDVLGNAIRMGYTKAISALMHIDNKSQKISRACARPMRRYELFARCLNG